MRTYTSVSQYGTQPEIFIDYDDVEIELPEPIEKALTVKKEK